MKNWKTSLAGAVAAAGVYLKTVPGFETVGYVMEAAGLFAAGLFARDFNK